MRSSLFRNMLIAGAGTALAYALARHCLGGRHKSVVDWGLAQAVAVRWSGGSTAFTPATAATLEQVYRDLVREVEPPIAEYTGTVLPNGTPRVQVLDRRGWIETNLNSLRELLAPVEGYYRERIARGLAAPPGLTLIGSTLLSIQIGLLLGFLAQRVLGQYDMDLLGRGPLTGGKLYFVEPNIRALQLRTGVAMDQLRRWVVLHEATHAHEFECYPWVRAYLNSALEEYITALVEDLGRSRRRGATVPMLVRALNSIRSGQSLIETIMSPRQRELVSMVQALMSLAEGYSNHVMAVVGRKLLPDFDRIQAQVERRHQQRSQVEELFLRATGLKMKLDQYLVGEQFVSEVVRLKGIEFANRAWWSPETLPSERELRSPEQWIARIEASHNSN